MYQHELQALHAMTAASIVAMLNKLADLLDRSDWSDEQAAQLQQRKAVSFAAMITSLSTFSDADATSLLDVSSEALGSAAWLVNDATTDRLVAAANIENVETSKKTQTLTNLTNYLTQDDWSARLTTGSSYSTWESCISDRLQGLGVFSPHEQTVKAAVSLLTWLKATERGARDVRQFVRYGDRLQAYVPEEARERPLHIGYDVIPDGPVKLANGSVRKRIRRRRPSDITEYRRAGADKPTHCQGAAAACTRRRQQRRQQRSRRRDRPVHPWNVGGLNLTRLSVVSWSKPATRATVA